MQTDLVIVSEYCQKCHIDPSFIILLEEGGLIDINITDGERYLFSSQLRDLEQYTRMYYDLPAVQRLPWQLLRREPHGRLSSYAGPDAEFAGGDTIVEKPSAFI